MADLNASLVQDERAAEWLDTFSMETARFAHMGNPDDFKGDTNAHNAIQRANTAVADGISIIRRLTKDVTKTEPVRHEAAGRVAAQVEANLTDTAKTLLTIADQSFSQGADLVNDTFQLQPHNAFVDSKLHDWIREQASKPDGIAAIREAVQSDRDVANVLWASKPFLLGLNAEVLGKLKMDAVSAHVSKANVLFDNAKKLQATANRYPAIVRDMKASFFNKGIADRAASTRVNV